MDPGDRIAIPCSGDRLTMYPGTQASCKPESGIWCQTIRRIQPIIWSASRLRARANSQGFRGADVATNPSLR